jgi:hypothetical protein
MEKTSLELLREAAQIMQKVASAPAQTALDIAVRDAAKQWLLDAPLECLGLTTEQPSLFQEGA